MQAGLGTLPEATGLGWASKGHLTVRRRAGGGPDPQGSPSTLLSCWLSPAYSDTDMGVEGTALSSAVLAGKKQKDFLIA